MLAVIENRLDLNARRGCAALVLVMTTLSACRRGLQHRTDPDASSESEPQSLLSDAGESSAPPRGMVWVPAGPLVVGTAPNTYPRRPDRELAGEQVVMHGYYIDKLPYPNEEGAIPSTNITQSNARALCEKQHKRLCTELEWERACKGPAQHTFEYGEHYREDVCATGTVVVPRPSGFNVGCQSDFGVHDMHGGVYEWTDSAWGRGNTNPNKVVIRGGNDVTAEVVARCANAEPRSPESQGVSVGFRCCAGPVNEVQVQMRVEHGPPVAALSPDPGLLGRLISNLTPAASKELGDATFAPVFSVAWRPIGNERLVALSICSQKRALQRCAVLVGRDTPGMPTVLGAANTGFFPSKLYVDEYARDAWVLGTDARGPFRRLLRYNWGRLDVGPRELQTKAPKSKKSKHSEKAPAAN